MRRHCSFPNIVRVDIKSDVIKTRNQELQRVPFDFAKKKDCVCKVKTTIKTLKCQMKRYIFNLQFMSTISPRIQ